MSKKKSQHNLAVIKSDYVVIILNADDEAIDPMLDLFYSEVLQRKRRAIAAINRETITETIMAEKDNPEILKARPFVQVGECPPADSIMAIINLCTTKWLKENDRFLDIQTLNRQHDVLASWTETDDPLIVEPAAKGKGKGKDKPSKSASKTKKAGKPVKLDPLVKVELPVYKVKNWSSLPIRGQSSNTTVYVEDAPVDGPSMYIVVMGVYSKDLLVEMVRAHIPVIAVIKLTASDVQGNRESGSHAKYWQDIEHIKPNDAYKSIAFFDVATHAHSFGVLRDHRNQVNDELTYLLYDTQDMRQQHRNYLDNIEMQDVAEKRPCVALAYYPVYSGHFDGMPVQQISVECILDAIVQQVAGLNAKPEQAKIPLQTHPSLASIVEAETEEMAEAYLKPLNCVFENKIVLEQSDQLAQAMIGVVDVDFEVYKLRLNSLSSAWNLQRFIEEKTDVVNQLPDKTVEYTLATLYSLGMRPELIVPRSSEDSSVATNSDDAPPQIVESLTPLQTIVEQALKLPAPIQHYVELMTAESLRQQLIKCLQTYANVQQISLPFTNAILVTFSEPTDTLLSSDFEHSLVTPVCLRDYVDYIVDEQAEWIREQEQQSADARNCADLAAAGKRTADTDNIVGDEFMVLRSLKKPEEDVQIDVETVPKLVEPPPPPAEDKKGSKKKKATIAVKKTSILDLLPNRSDDPAASRPFRGFNLDDRRYQLNSRNLVFRSSLATFQMGFDEWLYRTKTLAIDIQLDNVHITCGKSFTNAGHPAEHIDNVLLRHPDGWQMVLEVVTLPVGWEPQVGRWTAMMPEVCRREDGVMNDGDERMLVVRLVWSNGLTVRTLATTDGYAVEQVWTNRAHETELRRRMLANGWVVVYYESGRMRVMSADGMVVQTGDAEEWADAEEFGAVAEVAVEAEGSVKAKSSLVSLTGSKKSAYESETTQVVSILPDILHGDALRALMVSVPELADRYFQLTTCNGSVFLVDGGEIVKTLKPLHVVELVDCALGELFLRRSDGMKMLFRSDNTRCLYADGTEIWSNLFVEDMPSYLDFEFDDQNGSIAKSGSHNSSSIQNPSLDAPESVTSSSNGHKLIETVVDKFIQNSAAECFEYVDRSFTFQHAAYEEVVFENNGNPCVRFPRRGNAVYTRTTVEAQLTATVTLRCDLAECLLTAQQCAQHQKQTTVRIFGNQDEPLILDCSDGFGRQFTIDRWAKPNLVEDHALPQRWKEARLCSCPRQKTLRTRHFVVGRQFDGYEILPQALVEQILADAATNAVYVHRDAETIAVLYPAVDPQPVVIHAQTDKFHNPVHNVKCCVPTVDIAVKHMAEIPPVTLLRYFVRVPGVDADLREQVRHGPIAKNASRRSSDELPSIRNVLCEAAVKALQALLHAKKETYMEQINPTKKPLSDETVKHKKGVLDAFSRAHLYRRMLRTGFIPRYETFHLASSHVRNLDSDEMNTEMDLLALSKMQQESSVEAKLETSLGKDVLTTDGSFAKHIVSDVPNKCRCSHTPCCCNYLC